MINANSSVSWLLYTNSETDSRSIEMVYARLWENMTNELIWFITKISFNFRSKSKVCSKETVDNINFEVETTEYREILKIHI